MSQTLSVSVVGVPLIPAESHCSAGPDGFSQGQSFHLAMCWLGLLVILLPKEAVITCVVLLHQSWHHLTNNINFNSFAHY